MTTSPTQTRPTQPLRQQLPKGLHWSSLWRTPDGAVVDGVDGVEVPVDRAGLIAGRLWMCPVAECSFSVWTFGDGAEDDPACCRQHPVYLDLAPLSPDDRNPVAGARSRLAARAAGLARSARDRALEVANVKLDAARQNVADVSRRTAADMRGHVPSLAASGMLLAGAATLAATVHPAITGAVGVAVGTAGTVAAYVLVWLREKWRARRDGVELVGKAAKKMRARARHIAAAAPATGLWLTGGAAVGVDPRDPLAALWLLLVGPLLSWLVNKSHWDKLWADRARLRELARRKAEEAARRAAEEAARAERHDAGPAQVRDDTPEAMGAWMAQEWARIAASDTVPIGFPMHRTRIVAEETREVTAPVDGQERRIGWEFAIRGEPGALVARMGAQAPLVAAREWLASMLERDPNTVELVDRPGGQVNRGLLMLTDSIPLGGVIKWKGKAGIRIDSSGAIYAHIGRSIIGDDVEEALYLPGQPFGGMDVGHTGGGKGVGTILALLNALATNVMFPILHDPKQLLDYADFVGVFPIGVSDEHRDVIVESLHAERVRREAMLSTQVVTDRYGRQRRQQARWDTAVHGPLIHHFWDEFHLHALAKAFLLAITQQQRLQRAAGMGGTLISQGGGLADFGDSVLRGLLNQVRLRLYRMPDNLARLAGYTGAYMPSQLPRLAGMCLTISDGAPPLPLRTAFVTRDIDDENSVYDQLYAPDGTPLLTAPTLPKETVEVWKRTGLIDLWEMGKGPDGLDRLLSEAPGPEGLTPPPVPSADGTPRLPAEDVILAILRVSGGSCRRAVVDTHEVWLRPAAGGAVVAPSTISRAAGKLEGKGLITRDGQGPNRVYQLTAEGEEPAKGAAMVILLSGPAVSAPVRTSDPVATPRTAADVEREAEAAAEQAALNAP